MKALLFERKPARYAASMVAGALRPGRGAAYGPLSLSDIDPHELPGDGWVRIRPRLAGICGSDLATMDGQSSRYFEDIVSFPFVPGHEVVADTEDGTRVILEPVLGCVARNISPVCASCAAGHLGNCERLAFGDIEPGLQSGFCCDTGGGWSTFMVAHQSQLHAVPDEMSDEAAVIVEPTACAVHGALAHPPKPGDLVVILGAGTLGLLTLAAMKHFFPDVTTIVGARYLEQRAWATKLGATHICAPDEVGRLVRRLSGSLAYGNQLTGGADLVIDCVGSSSSITEALRIVKPRGRITLVGMPNNVSLNLTGLWHRETQLAGAYAYGTETLADGTTERTFKLAMDLVAAADLGRLVSATYPLKDYKDALEHAASSGRRGAVKIAFDLRNERERNR
jgi:threonine dehydrogenase-like Zn-dependent dehydrogenase